MVRDRFVRRVVCVLLGMILGFVARPAKTGTYDPAPRDGGGADLSSFVYHEDEELYQDFIIRRYYIKGPEEGAEPVLFGESFGFGIDDHYADIDGDGRAELLCNCTYGGDGVRRLFVYKLEGNCILEGVVAWDAEDLPGLDDYGAGAIQTWYDASNDRIVIDYCTGPDSQTKLFPGPNVLKFTPKVSILWYNTEN